MRPIKYLALAALVAFAACDEETGGPAATGTVQVTVSAAGTGIAGVTVSLGAAGTQPAQTNATGQVTFSNVAVGSYVASISGLSADYACAQTSQPVVVGSGQTTSVTFACNLVQTASIAGSVSNVDGSARSGASIAITRTAPAPAGTAVTVTTGTNGQYSLTGLRSGTYSVVLAITANCTTAATTQNATIAAGEARVVNFTCTTAPPPPVVEPATVSIQSITSGPLGTGVAVPDNAVLGTVNVHVTVNEGGQRVTRVELLIGNQIVGTQVRTVAAPEDMQLAEFQVSFVVNTAEFNQTTGVPRFINTASPGGAANNALAARIFTAAGGATTAAGSATRTIALVNVDAASITITPSSTVLGGAAQSGRAAQGLRWWTGDLAIVALPVLYSGHTATSVTLTVDGYNGTANAPTGSGASTRAAYLADPLVDNSTVTRTLTAAPWSTTLLAANSVTAGTSATATTRGVGDIEDIGVAAGGAFQITFSSLRDDAQPGPTVVFSTLCDNGAVPTTNFPPTGCSSGQPATPIRMDTFAPVVDQLNQWSRWSGAYAWVPPPAPETGQGVTRWVNEGFTPEFTTSNTTDTQPRATDRGTGIASAGFYTFEFGTDVNTMTAFTTGANLAETLDNNVYYIRATARDVGGRARPRFNDGTQRGLASPLSTANMTALVGPPADPDARSGADHHNPFMQLLGTPGPLLNLNTEVIGGFPAVASDGTAIQAQYIDCHGVVDPLTGVCTIDTFTSNPSGFPPNPVRTRIQRQFPGLSDAAKCWIGNFGGTTPTCRILGTRDGQSGTTGNYDFSAGTYTAISPTTGVVSTFTFAGDGVTSLATNPVGYYTVEMDALDAAGNQSTTTNITLVRDFTPPTVGGVFFGAVLTPGQPTAFSAGVADDLEVNRGEGFLEVGAALDAFRQSTTQVGTFGPGDGSVGPNGFTQQSTLSATVTFVHSMQVGSATPPVQTTRFSFRVRDFGRNSNTAFSGAFPPPTVALRNYAVGVPSVAITLNSENLTSSFNVLCWDTDADGCATTPNTSAVLSFTLSGAGSSAAGGPLQIPFTRVEYYVGIDENNDGVVDTDPAGNALWTSLGIAGVSVTENVGATIRTYNWSRSSTAAELAAASGRTSITAGAPIIVANNIWLRVVGYSADGNSFTVADGALACPVPATAPPGATCSIQLTQD